MTRLAKPRLSLPDGIGKTPITKIGVLVR